MRLTPGLGLASFLLLSISNPLHGDEFKRQVVVSQEANASDVGRDILRKGGNAVDAAVGTAFALAVTHPAAGNIGGGGFLVAYLADRKQVVSVDFREMAPKSSTETMYLGKDGKLLPHHRAGPRAAGVPGTVSGLELAHKKWGKLPWAELVRPSVVLAREGFVITDTLAQSLNSQLFRPKQNDLQKAVDDLSNDPDRLSDFEASVAAFRRPDGKPWKGGDRLIQKDLADTLERIEKGGADGFYKGKTADLIVAHMKALGGEMTADDLAAYRAKERTPLSGTYRGHTLYGMGPPASGGILILQMLNILEPFDLKGDGPKSEKTIHRVTEAMRRAFYTRASVIADPDFVSIPVETLISKPHAAWLALNITDKATPSETLAPFPIDRPEGMHTTHFSTMDSDGSAVALTYTLEEGYGSKSVVPGAGFLLNNEMGDFNLIPGRTDTSGRIGTVPNRIAPRKRMLSSQSPTIVLKNGKVRVVTGSPGGRTIPNTTLWVLLNVLEFGLEPKAAVEAPRTHHQWFPDVLNLEGRSWPESTRDALKARGHTLRILPVQGDAHTIIVDEAGVIHGVPDPRRSTSKASGD